MTAFTGSLPALGRRGVATLGLSCAVRLCDRRRLSALRDVPIVLQDGVKRVASASRLLHAQILPALSRVRSSVG
jgi:hypothetical protein